MLLSGPLLGFILSAVAVLLFGSSGDAGARRPRAITSA